MAGWSPIARSVRRWARGGSLALLVLVAVPALPVEGRSITFDLELGYWCAQGRANDRAAVNVTWRDAEGSVKQQGTARADANGYWSYCGDGDERLETGDTVRARVGTASRTVTLPRIVLILDRVADQVTGRVPADSWARYAVCRRGDGFDIDWDGCTGEVFTVPITTFTHDAPDIRGRDWAVLTVTDGGDRFTRGQSVPFITVRAGSERFWGYYQPFRNLTVELRDDADALRDEWSGRADTWDWGHFMGRFADAEGETFRARPGDRVVAPKLGSDADFTIPDMSLAAAKGTDVVSGSCLPGRRYEILAWSPNGARDARVLGTANAGGTFSRDLSSRMDLRRGDIVLLTCRLATGDHVERRRVVD